ncbi:head decoration protein [Neorhizobium tomejilense]|uniref:head decoration protein n=1 Tax=Neorhizobium tomejilense TaxID=2093828 RepID=UPI003ECC1FDB
MAEIIEKVRNEEFLLDEANGDISRGTVSLKSGSKYISGSVLIAVGATYEQFTDAALTADADADVVILARHTDATGGVKKAGVIRHHAAVKKDFLIVAATGATLATAVAALEKKQIAVRATV